MRRTARANLRMRTILSLLFILSAAAPSWSQSTEYVARKLAPEAETHSSEPAKVLTGFALPVYIIGYPERAYDFIGKVFVRPDGRSPSRQDVIRAAADAAKTHGADAILAGWVNPNVPDPKVLFTARAVKWRSGAPRNPAPPDPFPKAR